MNPFNVFAQEPPIVARGIRCRVEGQIDNPNRVQVIGQIVQIHLDNGLDAAVRYVNPEAHQPIARLHADNYITSDRQFELKKPAYLTP